MNKASKTIKNKILRKVMVNLIAGMTVIMSAGTVFAVDSPVAIDETNFPDANFRSYVEQTVDTNNDKLLSSDEIDATTYINVRSMKITSLKGIEYFKSLKSLNCGNNDLTSVDIGANTSLTFLDLSGNSLESVDLSCNTALQNFSAEGNELSSVDLHANTNLETLDVSKNNLIAINTSYCTKLITLHASDNQLATIDLSANARLATVNLAGNRLSYIDLSHNRLTGTLNVNNNRLSLLDIKENTALSYIDCSHNKLLGIYLPGNAGTVIANDNKLAALDVSALTNLKNLNLADNVLYNIDMSSNAELEYLNLSGNFLAALDISGCPLLVKDNISLSGNSRNIYVSPSNEANLSYTGINAGNITSIATDGVSTGASIVLDNDGAPAEADGGSTGAFEEAEIKLTIGRDGKIPEKVNYTYNIGNGIETDFELIPTTVKKIITGSGEVDICLIKGETQPSYPLYAIALGDTADIRWSCTDSSIASVSESGEITPIKTGSTSVSASADGFDAAVIKINVIKESDDVIVDAIDTQYYTGSSVTPEPVVKIGTTLLKKDTDYTLLYQNNVNVGTASVIIRGKGAYSFEITAKFKICYNIATMVSDPMADQVYNGNELTPDTVIKNGSYVLVKNVDYTLSYVNNKEPGTAVVTVTGKGSYAGTRIQTFNIIIPQVTNLKVSNFYQKKLILTWDKIETAAGYRIYKYNPSTKKYAYLAQLDGQNANTYTDINLLPGTQYRYRVRAFVTVNKSKVYGKYSSKYKTYTKPAKVSLKAAAGTKSATLTWGKITGSQGYRIYMRTGNGAFKRIKEITKAKTIKFTKTGLKKGKSYSFKVRAFRTIDGAKRYGSYSAVRTVTAK